MADDDLNWLYGLNLNAMAGGGYIPNVKSFLCPTTRNAIDTTVWHAVNPQGTLDLFKVLDQVQTKALDKNSTTGHSYEVFGWWHRYDLPSGKRPRKTLQTVQTYVNANYNAGSIPGPAGIFTIMDRLEAHAGNNENAPNPLDGHGKLGANAVFCDGHGQFVPAAKWENVYKTSEDDPNPLDGKVN